MASTIELGATPNNAVVDSAGTRVYVAPDAIAVIDVATGTVTGTLDVRAIPRGVAITPDGGAAGGGLLRRQHGGRLHRPHFLITTTARCQR